MSDESPQPQYQLVMPFVTVASKGGPHDDDSYVAGWQMAELDALIKSVAGVGNVNGITVAEANRPQADLIAMNHGWVAAFEDSGVEGWLFMNLSHGSEIADGDSV